MRIGKSKKGIGTSIISDVFAVMAYMLIFTIAIIIISNSGLNSRAVVKNESLKTSYNLLLETGLKTPLYLESQNTTFADYSASLVDVDCQYYDLYVFSRSDLDKFIDNYRKELEQMMTQMEPFFMESENNGLCFKVEYDSLPKDCKAAETRTKMFVDIVNERLKKTKPCENRVWTWDDEIYTNSLKFYSKRGILIKAGFYHTQRMNLPFFSGGGPFAP